MAAPDASVWLAADEADRLEAVRRQHKHAGERSGNPRLHAAVHVTIETQLAEGLAPVVRAMQRLADEGLDRHDALHAVGSVVAEQMVEAVHGRGFDATEYETRLDALSAASWRGSFGVE
jgi:hypothetical protein